jgi:hypothetical protein
MAAIMQCALAAMLCHLAISAAAGEVYEINRDVDVPFCVTVACCSTRTLVSTRAEHQLRSCTIGVNHINRLLAFVRSCKLHILTTARMHASACCNTRK